MSRIEYDLLVAEFPEGTFPEWILLGEASRTIVEDSSREVLLARRMAKLMRGHPDKQYDFDVYLKDY